MRADSQNLSGILVLRRRYQAASMREHLNALARELDSG